MSGLSGQGTGVTPQAGPGCQPTASAAEEASSQSGIPNAAREDCDICGARPIRVIVEGRALCEEHRDEWLGHDAENQIQRVILAISTASVPHEHWMPGALSSRSLGYYLGVGIDHFRHDYARHETLLRKAAEQAIAAIRIEAGTGGTTKSGPTRSARAGAEGIAHD